MPSARGSGARLRFSDACADLETDPVFIDLPRGSGTVEATSSRIRPGAYDELEFENDDLDDVSRGAPLAASAARAHRLAFSPDGRTLVVASERGEIDGWDLDAEAWLARACTRAVGAEAGGAWAAALQTL